MEITLSRSIERSFSLHYSRGSFRGSNVRFELNEGGHATGWPMRCRECPALTRTKHRDRRSTISLDDGAAVAQCAAGERTTRRSTEVPSELVLRSVHQRLDCLPRRWCRGRPEVQCIDPAFVPRPIASNALITRGHLPQDDLRPRGLVRQGFGRPPRNRQFGSFCI